MRDVMARGWRYLHTPEGRKISRYLMGSVICTTVSFAVLSLVYGVRLMSAVPATLFANVVATIPSYFLNRNWAWGRTGRGHVWREMLPFWVASLTGIGLSMGGAALAKAYSDQHHLHHLMSTAVVDGANLLTFVVLWVAKFLFFNRIFRTHAVASQAELVEAA